jgi:hypothetical protein
MTDDEKLTMHGLVELVKLERECCDLGDDGGDRLRECAQRIGELEKWLHTHAPDVWMLLEGEDRLDRLRWNTPGGTA